MKKKFMPKKIVSLALCAILLFSVFGTPAVHATGFYPTPVNGKILTAAKAGDTSDWIEIARSGKYSLIVRKNYINIYNGYANNPMWQYTAYGANSAANYNSSYVRTYINSWFSGGFNGCVDKLSMNARLRQFTVMNDATNKLGTACSDASLTNGFSSPIGIQAQYGTDVAFALSYTESAAFLSLQHFMRNRYIANEPSNPYAAANYKKMNIPSFAATRRGYGMWLRTPGDVAGTAAALSGMETNTLGRVFQFWKNNNGCYNEYGLVYPALWVDNGVFEEKFPISVKYYKDYISDYTFINQVSLPDAPVGTFIEGVDLKLFAPAGYTVPGQCFGDTIVAARQNVVKVLYTKPVTPKYPTYVYYHANSADGPMLGMVPLPLAEEGSEIKGINATLYAPPGYTVPGEITGDKYVKAPFSTVRVIYKKSVVTRTIHVLYFKDKIGGEQLGSTTVQTTGELGTPITNIDDTLFAPPGYPVPGKISGDSYIKDPYMLVYVVYSKPVEKKTPVYVFYYKDLIGGEYLGMAIVYTTNPVGTSLTGVVDTKLYAPSELEFEVPGKMSGDLTVKEPHSLVYVIYPRLTSTS